MTTNELCLLLGDVVAGRVSRLPGGKLTFEYDRAYAATETAHATPLSVSMPIQVASHTDGRITPWLWGLLPDNDAVLNRWSRAFHVSARSPFSLLSTPLGLDCPGNVRLVPSDQLSSVENEPDLSDVEWLTEAQVAQRLRDLKQDGTAWLGAGNSGRFSLAGAQAKTALVWDDGRWGEPRGATATTHILKPAIEGFDDHDLNEHLCLTAMRAAGLLAVHSSVERFEDQSAIAVARYDRSPCGQQVRVHQEDLCQALGVHPAGQYQNEGGPGPRRSRACSGGSCRRRIARGTTDDLPGCARLELGHRRYGRARQELLTDADAATRSASPRSTMWLPHCPTDPSPSRRCVWQ